MGKQTSEKKISFMFEMIQAIHESVRKQFVIYITILFNVGMNTKINGTSFLSVDVQEFAL